jgi:hypothetical protein
MKQQHHPLDTRLYLRGANPDLEDELLSGQEGIYYDAVNMTTNDMSGKNSAAVKIQGEEIKYPAIDNRCNGGTGAPLSPSYECIGVVEINEHIVEFWADGAGVEPPFIRVDGLIVCMTYDFPIQALYPLQIAKNEACIGGEVYITDFNVPPMLFNIKDLLVNSGVNVGATQGVCTEKYFSQFNLNEHLLILKRVLDRPAFIRLDSQITGYDHVFGVSGLPFGYYTYSFRYVTQDGERTSFSAPSNQIPVVRAVSGCSVYPGSRTRGGFPDITASSGYGVHFRMRVNNEANYDFIEVRRDRWNDGAILGVPANSEIIGKFDISNGEFSVLDILDFGAEPEEVLSGDDVTNVMAAVNRAKAIRYFNSRLYLMNIEYASRVIDIDVDIIDDGNAIFPCVEKMGKLGHNDIYKAVHNKSQMRGEQRAFGVVLWDDQGQWSYAKKINTGSAYQMPNRREEVSADALEMSYFGVPVAANVSNIVSNTYEVFDLADAVQKTNACLFANIFAQSGSINGKNLTGNDADFQGTPCPDAPAGFVSTTDIGYKPFRPTGQDDANCSYLNYCVNIRAFPGGSSSLQYFPYGFEPNYFSLGIAFKGIDSWPEWAQAFSVVQTAPAGRVVAQGLGYYQMESATGTGNNTGKSQNTLAVFFPDLDEDMGLNVGAVDDIINNPTQYEIEIVAPLGFFTEVWSHDNKPITGRSDGIDMITYCRIIKDNGVGAGYINPTENPLMGIDDGSGNRYVAFGKWRSDSQFGLPATQKTYGITAFVDHSESGGRQKYFRVSVNGTIYNNPYAGTNYTFHSDGVKNWHEPVYVINIVKKNTGIADTNVTNYEFAGHYQKLKALVGISNGDSGQNFILVDERWEDCKSITNGILTSSYTALERFVYIEDPNGIETRWLCVDGKTAGQITSILTDLTNNGVYNVTDTSGTYPIYGIYRTSQSSTGTCPDYYLDFTWFNTSFNINFFVPQEGFRVYVRYDNRIPVRVFGGDTWIGENMWAVKDKRYNKNGNPANDVVDIGNGQGDRFSINIPFPFQKYRINPRIYIVESATGLNNILDQDICDFNNNLGSLTPRVRQLIAMWTSETRVAVPFGFNDEVTKHSPDQFFPLKNYVMSPYEWSDSQFGSGATAVYADNNLWADYETDYGDEYLNWGLGGFRFRQNINIDYSKADNTRSFTTTPKLGFEDNSHYCSRVIWSERRPSNIQDTPSVRTFPQSNVYDVSDDTGEIKFAWSAVSNNSNNLYAITDSGICLLLVDKRVLYEINADELATVGSDIGGILNEVWLTRTIGMSDEMWRSAAEFDESLFFVNKLSSYRLFSNQLVDIGRLGYHSVIYGEYISNFGTGYLDHITGVYDPLKSEYWVTFNKVRDVQADVVHTVNELLSITDIQYDTTPNPHDLIAGVDDGDVLLILGGAGTIYLGSPTNTLLTKQFTICLSESAEIPLSVVYFNGTTMITLVTMEQGDCYCITPILSPLTRVPEYTIGQCVAAKQYKHPTLVFGNEQQKQLWQGRYDYLFDRYLYVNNRVYGMRDAETYELGRGNIINTNIIQAEMINVSSTPQPSDKEFIRIRVNSDNKPSRVEFFANTDELKNNDIQAELDVASNSLALKNYFGYEQYIPRRLAPPHYRMQGRAIIYKIMHNLDENFRIVSTNVQYKTLK